MVSGVVGLRYFDARTKRPAIVRCAKEDSRYKVMFDSDSAASERFCESQWVKYTVLRILQAVLCRLEGARVGGCKPLDSARTYTVAAVWHIGPHFSKLQASLNLFSLPLGFAYIDTHTISAEASQLPPLSPGCSIPPP
jgi:hypothetical protein